MDSCNELISEILTRNRRVLEKNPNTSFVIRKIISEIKKKKKTIVKIRYY